MAGEADTPGASGAEMISPRRWRFRGKNGLSMSRLRVVMTTNSAAVSRRCFEQ
jgi:hypothetical protein